MLGGAEGWRDGGRERRRERVYIILSVVPEAFRFVSHFVSVASLIKNNRKFVGIR